MVSGSDRNFFFSLSGIVNSTDSPKGYHSNFELDTQPGRAECIQYQNKPMY
jgi:hypothetical protein